MTIHSPKRALTAGVAALTTALVLAGCGGDDDTAGTSVDNPTTTAAAPRASATADDQEHNDADVTFVQMMIPHHGQAIEMSNLILGKDDAPEEVTALAAQVVAAQQPEIDQMTGWLEAWGEDVPDMDMGMGMGMDDPMNGMLSQEDVDAIGDATGADAARLYLESLKAHHQGAIEMAEEEVEDGMNPDVIALAETIIEMQQAEITQIDELLAAL